MARPKKIEKDRQTTRLVTYVTKSESRELRDKAVAYGLPVGTWMRLVLLCADQLPKAE